MKGIILAGGTGSRLAPITSGISKHLIPLYDKPTIYYPISTLMLAGINEITIICTPKHIESYQELLKDTVKIGLNITFVVQEKPLGIPHALLLASPYAVNQKVALICGDNFFYGRGLSQVLKKQSQIERGACIFGYRVSDPERYGVIELDTSGKLVSLEEKPKKPKSNIASVGLYFYDETVFEKARSLKPSKRGELEVTDLNKLYLSEGNLRTEIFGRGTAWFDTGTSLSLLAASNFVHSIQESQGYYIGCLEEISLNNGWITKNELSEFLITRPNNSYFDYVRELI